MIVIDQIIVSDDVRDEFFACDLRSCKGACCVQGEEGAPLEKDEANFLDDHFDEIKPFLSRDGIRTIKEKGKSVFSENSISRTPLINESGACAYVIFDEGIAKCGIENAFNSGKTSFRKPISCHLYPVRITKYEGYDAVNYSKWEICDPACSLGKSLSIPLYKFLKEALIRKYGEQFYIQLEGAIKFHEQSKLEQSD